MRNSDPPSWESLPSPVLLIGPAYSGKSDLALSFTNSGDRTAVLGTADPQTPGLAGRLAHLQHRRPKAWSLEEQSRDLPASLAPLIQDYDQVIVDSLNQWVGAEWGSALGEAPAPEIYEQIAHKTQELVNLLDQPPARIVLVTGEAGAGPPPAAAEERLFRQTLGVVNQKVAAASAAVVSVTAGIPCLIKGPGAPA